MRARVRVPRGMIVGLDRARTVVKARLSTLSARRASIANIVVTRRSKLLVLVKDGPGHWSGAVIKRSTGFLGGIAFIRPGGSSRASWSA